MFKKILCLILILKLTQARYGFVPKFNGQDIAIIVDTDKPFPQNKNPAFVYPEQTKLPPPFPLWRHYPRYHIVPPPLPGQILAIRSWPKTATVKPAAIPTTKSTTTTTTTKPTITSTATGILKSTSSSPHLTDEEYPAEFLDIAKNKLGLKSIEEIPSILELGQLLGTNSREETLNYIKKLSSNEQGVALMKAYIESTDYTDNTGDLNSQNNDFEYEEKDDIDDTEEPINSKNEGLIVITDEDSNDDYELSNEEKEPEYNTPKTFIKPTLKQTLEEFPQNNPNFIERIANYMHIKNLFHKNEDVNDDKENHKLNRITENGKKVASKQRPYTKGKQENQTKTEATRKVDAKTPILIRESIPFNYPIPIRVQKSSTTAMASSNTPVVHLNTPKMFIPHVQQLSHITNIPPKKIEDFLMSKPKLLELATKVSRFPIGSERNSPVEAQIMAAVQKAFEQDEDLQKLLTSKSTLK